MSKRTLVAENGVLTFYGKTKFSWGELLIIGVTKKFSIGVDTIVPHKETDKEGTYLKKGRVMYFVIKGRGLCGDKPIKSGDILQIKEGQKINIQNNSSKKLIIITIYMPPYNEDNIGYET
ncbi:hypothetical protein KKB64_00425 [Patescibacteria group bacterium]|nr:hypothetical protein [Patescibacteria group bacterium]MBU1472238.1 hypothetical protein [Patescibacteria group bacterium]MBU2460511.1 hypothetical protein [Patescibacteria group bacterium]MBU2544754.1 hypothetical protein [Patescibacteria group bacterium]